MLTPYVKKPKPPFPYDRPLSHSQLSTFKWKKMDWYRKYVLGEVDEKTPQLEFGSYVDKKFQDDATFLAQIPRLKHLQYKLECTFSDIPLIGLPDGLDLDDPELMDLKTGVKPWDKKRADETLQLTMYLFMIYMIHKIHPEKFKCHIDWVPTRKLADGSIDFVEDVENHIKCFTTKRTMKDILEFGNYILQTRQEMIEFYNKQE